MQPNRSSDPPGDDRPTRRMRSALDERSQLRRKRDGRLVAGVSAGVAEHLSLPVLWVRAAFAVSAAFSGAGVLAYGLLWVFVPQSSGEQQSVTSKERQQGLGLLMVGIGLAVTVGVLAGVPYWLVGLVALVVVGAAVVWREADESQRRRWRQGARSGVTGAVIGGGGRSAAIRVVAGVALVAVGFGVFLVGNISLGELPVTLLAVLAALVGAAVLTVPWWVRLARDLDVERAGRIRSQERAEIAAHLHDSVLQTLALIQKQADSPREVGRLARGQERELRDWLYGPDGYGRTNTADGGAVDAAPDGAADGLLSRELGRICGEVEDAFAIKAQHVVVGDCELDQRLVATLAAAREAVVNAAKHAGVEDVSVYAEVEPEEVSVYVRDRGVGFDPDAVGEDRHGLADSIRARIERNGGQVRLRTAPGAGTEVQVQMPRTGAQ